MTIKLKGISTVDGRTVEVELKEPKDSDSKVPTLLFKYNYNTGVTPPPSSSQIRTNNANPNDVTVIWVHRVDNSNTDNKFLLMQLAAGDQLYVQDIDNSNAHAIYTLTADPNDMGGYVEFNCMCTSVGDVPLSGTALLLGILA